MSDWADVRADAVADKWGPAEPHLIPLIAAELRAAEERGRRRGVEEAAKEVESITHEGVVSELIAYAAKRVRALAPRDSGKEES